jgi:hypothetical protein
VNTVSAVYKRKKIPAGSIVLDYGGGKYDANIEYMKKKGVEVKVYDPYNRNEDYNEKTLNYFKANPAKYIVCANVLCVIKEDECILNILENIKKYSAPNATIYIQVYERNKDGLGISTKDDCWQRNQKTKEYLPFVNKVFTNADISLKGKIIEVNLKEET